MPKYKFPLFTPYINNDEKKVVVDCLNSNWISSKGKYIDKFEKNFQITLILNIVSQLTMGQQHYIWQS